MENEASEALVLDGSELTSLSRTVQNFIAAAKASSTCRAYRSDWQHFEKWCLDHELERLPASSATVALYISAMASVLKVGTIRRRLTVISRVHQAAGFQSPSSMDRAVVGETFKGIQRTIGTAQDRKQPLYTEQLRRMIRKLPENLQGIRDRALLLIGFAGGFRRSELASLDVADIAAVNEGLVVNLRRSKTDQEAQGREVAVPYGAYRETCPVRAYKAWLDTSGLREGPVFRKVDRHWLLGVERLHKDSVGMIVKRAVGRIGLDPDDYAGHSLRAGLATQSYINGAGELAIMQQTGHRSLTTLRKYIRSGSLFRENPAAKLGL